MDETTFAALFEGAADGPIKLTGSETGGFLSATHPAFLDQDWADREIDGSELAALVQKAAAAGFPVTIVGFKVEGGLNLQRLKARAPLRFHGCWFRGPVLLADADLHEVDLQGSRLDEAEDEPDTRTDDRDTEPGRPTALHAPRLQCLELCVRDVVASSQLQLYAARIGGDLRGAGLIVQGERATRERTWAIQLTNASVAYELGLDRAHLQGGINLGGASIGGQFRCYGTHIDVHDVGASRPALSTGIYAQRVTVGESVFCGRPRRPEAAAERRRFTCSGVVSFKGATVGGSLFLRDGVLGASARDDSPSPPSVSNALTVVDLDGAKVKDRLVLLGTEVRSGALDLRHCSVRRLEDQPETWDRIAEYHLAGFTYEAMASWPKGRRRNWVERSRDGEKPGPYLELARAFAAAGNPAGERRARITASAKAATPWERALLGPFRYGYRPWTVLIPLLALAIVTGLQVQHVVDVGDGFVQRSPTDPPIAPADCATAALPCPNAVLYATDAVTPPDLGQVSTWQPNESRASGRILSRILVVANITSWLLVGVLVAAVSGVLKRT